MSVGRQKRMEKRISIFMQMSKDDDDCQFNVQQLTKFSYAESACLRKPDDTFGFLLNGCHCTN
jgi:hypothetical protein